MARALDIAKKVLKSVDRVWSFAMPLLFIAVMIGLIMGNDLTREQVLASVVLMITALAMFCVGNFRVLSSLNPVAAQQRRLQSEIFVEGSPDRVWDEFVPRPRQDPPGLGQRAMRAVPDHPDQIDIALDPEITGQNMTYRIAIETVTPRRFVKISYPDGPPKVAGFTSLGAEYEIHPADDGTWLRYAEDVEINPILHGTLFRFVDPTRDFLTSIKAKVEGTTDTSLSARVQRATATGEDVAALPEMRTISRQATRFMGLMAVLLTLFIPIFLWALLTLIEV